MRLMREDVCWMCAGKLVWKNGNTVEDWNTDHSMYGEILLTELECSRCGAWVEYKMTVSSIPSRVEE